MRTIKIRLDIDKTRLAFLGDFHIGNNPNYDGIKRALEFSDKIILMGDLIEAAIPGSPGATAQQIPVQSQLEILYSILEKYKDKIIGTIIGNHEQRIFKVTGVDINAALAKQLNIENLNSEAILELEGAQGTQTNYVAVLHGIGAAKTTEGRMRNLRKLALFIEGLDAVVSAHFHELNMLETRRYDVRTQQWRTIYFVLTGGFTHPNYVSAKWYPVFPNGFAYVTKNWNRLSFRLVNIENETI